MREKPNLLDRHVVLVDDAEMLFGLEHADIPERAVPTGGRGPRPDPDQDDRRLGLPLRRPQPRRRCMFEVGAGHGMAKSRCRVLVALESASNGDLSSVRTAPLRRSDSSGCGLLARLGTTAPVELAVIFDTACRCGPTLFYDNMF